MAVKDIMAELHKAANEKFNTPQLYFHRVTKPLKAAKLSENSIYRLVAEYCVENEIAPSRMVEDTVWLLTELSKNLLVVRTSDRFFWLAKHINELKYTEHDDNHFICNSCHYIKRETQRYGSAKMCKECGKECSRDYAKKAKQESPKPEIQEVTAPIKQDKEPQNESETNCNNLDNVTPFIHLSDFLTEPAKGEVTVLVSCKMFDLKQLLEIIDPYLVKNAIQGDQNEQQINNNEANRAGEIS